MKDLTWIGKPIKSRTFTPQAKKEGSHNNSMLINGHLIHGISKDDCLEEFESNRAKYDDQFRNSAEHFIKI